MKKEKKKKMRLALVDTMFARFDMGSIAIDEIQKNNDNGVLIVRRTVPGIKDIAVECKILLENEKCDVALALGYVGSTDIDLQCAHEASIGIQQAKIIANKHIIEAFIHENEAWNEHELMEIIENRVRKHARNAVDIVLYPENLIENAGVGARQGKEDEELLISDRKIRIGLVISEFNKEITEKMQEEAKKNVQDLNAEIIEVISVPGVYDSPLAVKKLLMNKNIDCVAVLGAVVKGETKHDEVIVFNVADKITWLSLQFNKPVALGIIGPAASWQQAQQRASSYARHATKTAVKLAKKLRR